MTSILVTELLGFGLRNHFSLDVSGHCDVESIALNTIGFTFLCVDSILEPLIAIPFSNLLRFAGCPLSVRDV
jgi:hypothetical protein